MLFPVYIAARSSASGSALRHIAILDATRHGPRRADRHDAQDRFDVGGRPRRRQRSRRASSSRRPADLPARRDASVQTQVEQPNNLVGYLVLTDSTLTGKSARYAGRNASTINDIDKLRTVVRQDVMIARLQREGVRARRREGHRDDDVPSQVASASPSAGGRARAPAGCSPASSSACCCSCRSSFHGQNVLRGVLEEKSTRVAEVVISSVKPETLLAGKVLGVGARRVDAAERRGSASARTC